MMVTRSLSVAVLLLIVKAVVADEDPTVETPLGKVRGHWLTSRAGRKYMAFSGIPYAKPPVGELRFKAPVPLDTWSGVREAKEECPKCIQHGMLGKPVGQEDCLYLNVSTHNVSRKAPVMVFFHGGGFTMGTGSWTRPTYLMDEDLVIVIANYRLGIFGFLTFETKDLPGNQGLKDQVMALKWVKQNIASFGGDPNNVTIAGMSAGGASVYHHFVSPLSRGLFHRGISSSGSSYNPWALSPPGLARHNAEELMTLLGCPTSPQEAIPCVMEKDAKEIVEKFPQFLVFEMDPMLTFSPVLEEPGPGAFLESPVSKWEYNPVPHLMILSSAEGIFKVMTLNTSIKDLSDNFERLGPISLHYWASASHPEDVTKKVKEFYFPGRKEITKEDYVNVTYLYSDAVFNHGIIQGANKAKGEVYFLFIDYTPLEAIPGGAETLYKLGANHCGEFAFIWESNVSGFLTKPLISEKNVKLSKDLVKMFATFMETGVPNIPGSEVKWKTWTAEHNNYLHLTENGFSLKEGLLQERFKFWDTVNYKDRFDREPAKIL